MRDQDVRAAVHQKLLKESHLDPDCLVIDEFSISLGASRADIAVVNGILHGYELKVNMILWNGCRYKSSIILPLWTRLLSL